MGVLQHLEYFFLCWRRAHEVGVGLGQSAPQMLEHFNVIERVKVPFLTHVLIETFQNVQAAGVQDGGLVVNSEEIQKLFRSGKFAEPLRQSVHDNVAGRAAPSR